MQRKDPVLAAVLGFLFGGFGLFYVSIGQGFAALVVLITISLCTGGVGTIPMWIGCAAWGYLAAENYNKNAASFLLEDEELAQFRAAPAINGSTEPVRTAQPQPQNTYCIECGSELRAGAKFCGGCGNATG